MGVLSNARETLAQIANGLRTDATCFNCRNVARDLKLCSQCKVARYCDR